MHWYDEVEAYKRIDRWLGGFWGKGEGKRNGKWKWGIDCVRSVSVMLVLGDERDGDNDAGNEDLMDMMNMRYNDDDTCHQHHHGHHHDARPSARPSIHQPKYSPNHRRTLYITRPRV